ncbi:MAG TPA: Sec-independent protein translocase protein TatB [Acidimicrobiales bacterium]|nr:Sec-independent protein translocase protein TatB [Acidimicrobiales bacterium]
MFNVGGGELIVIALIALIVLGPSRLPGAARQVGKTMSELRRLSSGFQNELKTAFDDAERSSAPATEVPADRNGSMASAVDAVSSQANPAAKVSAAKRAPAKPSNAKKAPAKGAATKKTAARKTTARTTVAKKAAKKKTAAKKATARR